MAWKCPVCGRQNENSSSECPCGYSFFKILGIKPGASSGEAKQAYSYLQSVWHGERSGHDAIFQKKADERRKKIDEAFAAFQQYASGLPKTPTSRGIPKPAIIAGVVLVVITVSVLAFYQFQKSKLPATSPGGQAPATSVEQQAAVEGPGGRTIGSTAENIQQAASPASFPGGEITEEGAIDLVKKSQALLLNTMTEAIVRKWTEENADKLAIVGWKAKKMNDQKYFVSYTGLDGSAVRGFYFELDTQSGKVLNIAKNPELQKTYRNEIGQ